MKEEILITINLVLKMKIFQVHQQLHSLLKKGQREKEVTTLIGEKELLTQALLNQAT